MGLSHVRSALQRELGATYFYAEEGVDDPNEREEVQEPGQPWQEGLVDVWAGAEPLL